MVGLIATGLSVLGRRDPMRAPTVDADVVTASGSKGAASAVPRRRHRNVVDTKLIIIDLVKWDIVRRLILARIKVLFGCVGGFKRFGLIRRDGTVTGGGAPCGRRERRPCLGAVAREAMSSEWPSLSSAMGEWRGAKRPERAAPKAWSRRPRARGTGVSACAGPLPRSRAPVACEGAVRLT